MGLIERLVNDQRGGTAIEYGLICALVILAMMGALEMFAGHAISMLTNVSAAVSKAAPK